MKEKKICGRLLRFLAVYIMAASASVLSYTAVKAVSDAGPGRAVNRQTLYKSEMVYDVETGYYKETVVTTNIYYDEATGDTYTSVETVYNYYNYDGYTYELVFSKNDDTNTGPVPSAAPKFTPAPEASAVPDYRPVQTPYPTDNSSVQDVENEFDMSPMKMSVKRKSSTQSVIKWDINDNASGYYIFRSTSEYGTYKKIRTIDNNLDNTYNDKKLNAGKIYYYKIQAYRKTDSGILTSEMPEAQQVSTIKTQNIINKLKKLKKKYPDGKYWNHVGYNVSAGQSTYGYVTNSPCNHEGSPNGVASTCNKYSVMLNNKIMTGYQCYGFANLLGDKLFGKSKIKTHKSYKKSKVGDHVRYSGHSVVIIEKHPKYIKVAECNIGGTCKIKWGRKISKSSLSKATYYTRY